MGILKQGHHHLFEMMILILSLKREGTISSLRKVIKTVWTADENGFVAYGDHLPRSAAAPEAVIQI